MKQKLLAFLLSINVFLVSFLSSATVMQAASTVTERQADPSTMDTWQQVLDFSQNTRYAGKLWTDKTVFAKDYISNDSDWNGSTLTLNTDDDGTTGTIDSTSDFLHIFSALGSSEEIKGVPPARTVIVFDNSGSMYNNFTGTPEAEKTKWSKQRIALAVEAINKAIDSLMEASAYNEIAVVLFGDGNNNDFSDTASTHFYTGYDSAVTILPMKHYTPNKVNGSYTEYLKSGWAYKDASGNYPGADGDHPATADSQITGGGWVFVDNEICKIASSKHYTAYENGTTNIQSGYYVGMQELLKADKTKQIGTKVYPFVPSLVCLTDGQATDMDTGTFIEPGTAADGSPSARGQVNDPGNKLRSFIGYDYSADKIKELQNYWDMFVEEVGDKYTSSGWWSTYSGAQTPPQNEGLAHMKEIAETYSESIASMMLGTLMTTAYYKSAVSKEYKTDWDIYTISVDMLDPDTIPDDAPSQFLSAESGNVPPLNELPKGWIYNLSSNPTTMDPSEYFYKNGEINLHWLVEKGYVDSDATIESGSVYYHTCFPDYSNGEVMIQGIVKAAMAFKEWQSGQEISLRYQPWKEIKNILKDSSQYVHFANPYGHVNGYLLKPVQTVTFPKLDGNKYSLSTDDVAQNISYNREAYYPKTADDKEISQAFTQIVDDIMRPLIAPVDGTNDLGVASDSVTYTDPIGKYMDVKDVQAISLFGQKYPMKKTATFSWKFNNDWYASHGEFKPGWYRGDEYHEDVPESQNEQMWKDGWIYRLDSVSASKFVPTLETIDDPVKADPKQRNTEYTFYVADVDTATRRTLHMNPSYGTDADIKVDYDSSGGHLTKQTGVYALSDLRVWVEDTGDYVDPSLSSSLTDANFDEALWINIPANMLPLKKVTIKLGNPITPTTWEYESQPAWPIRIFYDIGINDSIRNEDGQIDLAAGVSPEYIKDNKITTANAASARDLEINDVEFFSNWYNAENRYSDYAASNQDYSFGDPIVSFSPSNSNRYYIFEKALPLYANCYQYTDGKWHRVTMVEDSESSAVSNPIGFGGDLIIQDLDLTPSGTYATDAEISAKLTELYNSASPDLSSKFNGTPKESDIVLLLKDRLSDVTKDSVSGKDPFPSEGYFYLPIEYYDLDPAGYSYWQQYVIARKGSEFGSAYKTSGISNGEMLCWHDLTEENPDYPYKSAAETGDNTRGKSDIPSELLSSGQYVLCAKPGGLRVGNMAQSLEAKGGDYTQYDAYTKERFPHNPDLQVGYYDNNITRTANNYYVPTIAKTSTSKDIIVNTYLGNNGRLAIKDTTLSLAKNITSPDPSNPTFEFQVYIANRTGSMSAIKTHYEEGKWKRQLHYIDLLTDDKYFLQTNDGKRAIVDIDGNRLLNSKNGYLYADSREPYVGDACYVYIGSPNQENIGSPEGSNLRVYHNEYCEISGEGVDNSLVHTDGTSYLAASVKLYKVSDIDAAEETVKAASIESLNSISELKGASLAEKINEQETMQNEQASALLKQKALLENQLSRQAQLESDSLENDFLDNGDPSELEEEDYRQQMELDAAEISNENSEILSSYSQSQADSLDEKTSLAYDDVESQANLSESEITPTNPAASNNEQSLALNQQTGGQILNRITSPVNISPTVLFALPDILKDLTPAATLTDFWLLSKEDDVIDSPYLTESKYLTQIVEFGLPDQDSLYVQDGYGTDRSPWLHTALVELEPDWGVTFNSLSENTSYFFSEKDGKNGYYYYSSTPAASLTDSTIHYLNGKTSDTETSAIFTNQKGAALEVFKSVTGLLGDKSKKFSFTVELFDKDNEPLSLTGNFGSMHFINGKASFELSDSEFVKAEGLPYDIRYTVKEAEADGYAAHVTGSDGDGELKLGGLLESWDKDFANYTNSKNLFYSFQIQKQVIDENGDQFKWDYENSPFTFSLEADSAHTESGEEIPKEKIPLPTGSSKSQTDSTGLVKWSDLEYEQAGVYTYKVKEIDDHQPAIWYDDTATGEGYTLTVTIKTDGSAEYEFEADAIVNKYEPDLLAQTGSSDQFRLFTSGIALMSASYFTARKRDEK